MEQYIVKYIENGVKKESNKFTDRGEAFGFQAGLIANRKRNEDGAWDIELVGVYNVSPLR